MLVALLLGTSAAGLWLAWPWIVPLVSSVPTSTAGSDLVVVVAHHADHRLRPLVAPPALARIARVWIATDPDHTARAVILARIALGSQGIRVGPADWPIPSPAKRRKLLRDAMRLTLWRATGSTGAWLAPQVAARKRAVCGV